MESKVSKRLKELFAKEICERIYGPSLERVIKKQFTYLTQINKIAKEKVTADSLDAQGAVPMPGTPTEYAALVRCEIQNWGEVIKLRKITLD